MVRRNNCALTATITVLSDISTAPIAGDRRIPARASTPAASERGDSRIAEEKVRMLSRDCAARRASPNPNCKHINAGLSSVRYAMNTRVINRNLGSNS